MVGNQTSRLGMGSWAMYDWANSAFSAAIQTFIFAAYFESAVATDEATGHGQWGLMVGMAGAVIAVSGPILGAVADQGGRRKPWIGLFTGLCVIATACLWFVKPDASYTLTAMLLGGAGIVGIELACVFYNAMLPGLVGVERVGRWSGWGWAAGYAGGLVCLILALQGFVAESAWFGVSHDDATHVRATFVLVAVWYAVFALPLFLFTPDRVHTGKRLTAAVRDGITQLGQSLRHVRQYGHIVRFLIAKMLYFDGLTTIFAFGGVFAAGQFGMTSAQVIQFGILLNLTAGAGAFAFSWIDDWIGGKRTIIVSLTLLIVTAAAALAAPSAMWFTIWGAVLGIFVGPVQAASRSFFARIIPPELSNEMFGLFAFSGKATAFAGPLLVGWIGYATGSQRLGMSVILVMLGLGLAVMCTVKGERKRIAD